MFGAGNFICMKEFLTDMPHMGEWDEMAHADDGV